ncbi:MAG TPA: c-type cytochrome domain-containing protein, partial [Planctomycetota bacterium]|nr:c-type cytochrome domain-containing protein [Planctomycetota bacterium]
MDARRTGPAFLALGVCLLAWGPSRTAGALPDDPKDFEEKIRPLITKYCSKCHGPEKKKGDLDLTLFKTTAEVLEQAPTWQKIVERVNAFEMPPEKSPQPNFEEKGVLGKWFSTLPKGKQ